MKQMILKDFQQSLIERCNVQTTDTVLVALSGGADSVALLHLLLQSNIKCIAAHCNFHLRGEESNEDQKFVESLCIKLDVPLHTIDFQTTEYAKENKISIEMAARELRYNWFHQLTDKLKIDLIATGHHGDDSIETFFLNLTRGTGIKGLTGIAWRKENIIRPLLFASSDQIRDYCQEHSLHYRIDSTNLESIYYRNKIRREIIPLFKEMNPSFFATMQNNMDYLNESRKIIEEEIDKLKEKAVAQEGDSFLIPISTIKEQKYKKALILELLLPYGFAGKQLEQIINSVESQPGKQFLSSTYRIIIDRYNLILTPLTKHDTQQYALEEGKFLIHSPFTLKWKIYPRNSSFKFSSNPKTIHLDADALDFPLFLRRPIKGDKFQPLGMQNFKKLSDFFIDEKLSIPEKEKTWILHNGEEIVWVVGMRIDNRFKITPHTKNILEIDIT